MQSIPLASSLNRALILCGLAAIAVPPASAATVNSGSVSTIVNVNAGLCVGIKGDSAESGALLQSQNCSGSDFQKWKFVRDTAGYYDLVNVGSGKCVDVTGGSDVNGTNMQQWNCSGADWQKWNVSDQGNGQFAVLSKLNGLALEVFDHSTVNGARIVQWSWLGNPNQKWTFPSAGTSAPTGVGPASGSIVTLKGVQAGNCIGVKGSSTVAGATLQSQGCSGSTFQQWKAVKDSAGDYDLINVGSGQCMDLPGASPTEKTVIQQWNCSGGAWQKWRFNNDGAGHFYITSKSSGLALDVLGSSTANGADIVQWAYLGGANQQWIASTSSAPTVNGLVGFGVGTTGGKGGATVTVNSCSALKSALTSTAATIIQIPDNTTVDCRSTHTVAACQLSCPANQDASKKFYRIPVGTQTCQDLGAASNTRTNINVYDVRLDVKSNKTVQGLGKNSKIVGATLNLGSASNVIVQNVTLENINPHVVEGGDGITLDNSRNIWIDHVTTRMISDGHVDIKNSQNVTLSWNRFDGYNTYVCGNQHHYTMAIQDSRVTLHHNFWDRASGRNPKIDGAATRAHLFNNYWLDITYFSIGSGASAQVLVENNYFANSAKPHWNNGGYVSAKGNIYTGRSATDPERDGGSVVFTDFTMYPYTLESASGLPASLSSGTGPR